MLENKHFELNPEQLSAYNAWAAKISEAHAKADAAESLEIQVVFSFSPIGREVVARCGPQCLVLESF